MFLKNSLKLSFSGARVLNVRNNSTLLIGEHDGTKLNPATLNALTACSKIGGDISTLIVGNKCQDVAKEASASLSSTTRVITGEHDIYNGLMGEHIAPLLLELQKEYNFTHIVAPSSAFSRSLLPRVAAKLQTSPISDVVEILDGGDTFKRNIYAGNALMTLKSLDSLKIITIRPTAFEAAEIGASSADSIDVTDKAKSVAESNALKDKATFVEAILSKSDRPELGSAKVVISGGRGMKAGEHFDLLYKLADKLGGAVGASRAAVDAGMVPNELQVGQTGKIVAPELYVAVGISGAIQHLAGMKDSKIIVCINKDPEAPIFQVSDYGLVADLFKAIPELQEKL